MSCCTIQLNELNRKVEFKGLVTTEDGQGGFETNFVKIRDAWCKIKPMKGAEKIARDRLNTTQMYVINCRYFSDILETTQAIFNGEELQIRSIVNMDMSNEWLEIIAERKAKAQ